MVQYNPPSAAPPPPPSPTTLRGPTTYDGQRDAGEPECAC